MEETHNSITDSLVEEQTEEDTNKSRGSSLGRDFVKSIVYAGLDAIVTCFSLISSISAGRLSSVDVLVLGFANMVADGVSMGRGDFVSTRTEKDMARKERDSMEREVKNRVGLQQIELLRIYQSLGMEPADAMVVVNILAKYKDIMVDEKMRIQKRIPPPDNSEKPWKNGCITFTSFVIFGSAPLLPFIVLIPFTQSESAKFIGACVFSILSLALLRLAKAKIAGENYLISVVVTLSNGGQAATAAYLIGWTLRKVAGAH